MSRLISTPKDWKWSGFAFCTACPTLHEKRKRNMGMLDTHGLVAYFSSDCSPTFCFVCFIFNLVTTYKFYLILISSRASKSTSSIHNRRFNLCRCLSWMSSNFLVRQLVCCLRYKTGYANLNISSLLEWLNNEKPCIVFIRERESSHHTYWMNPQIQCDFHVLVFFFPFVLLAYS